MQLTELSSPELARLRDMVKPVVDQPSDKVGADILHDVEAELAKLRK